ncbi:MAG: T9SS type A sorting domain-containing protein [Chitinophagales bacterium]|nr:T9SS type A sorting domain-containing protein [Chitinophagales bacterium]
MKNLISITVGIFLIMHGHAQTPGALDPSFQHGKYFNSTVNKIIQLSDGSFIAGGWFRNYDNAYHQGIVKLNADLTLDESFYSECPDGFQVKALAEYPGGKILVGGDFKEWNNNSDYDFMVMLNADGTIDASFSEGFNPVLETFEVNEFAVQPDGKIVVGGDFKFYDGVSRPGIVRINADGTLDTSFYANLPMGSDSDGALDIELLDDGRMMIGGRFNSINGATADGVARLNSDGSNDPTFNLLGATEIGTINDVELQSDGKILIGGSFPFGGSTNIPTENIARLNTDGSVDSTFYITYMELGFPEVFEVISQDDGKILITGSFETLNGDPVGNIARLNADGSTDPTFYAGTGGTSINGGIVLDVILLADDAFLAVGEFTVFNGKVFGCIVKLLNNGDIDNSISKDFGANGSYGGVNKIVPADDGKVWICGVFSAVGDVATKGVAKLNADGSTDTSFIADVNPYYGTVNDFAIQSDGKIIIGGGFTIVDGSAKNRIARLKVDGSRDNTFHTGTGFNYSVNTLAIQPDGKILAGGNFTTYNGTPVPYLVRLNSNGSQDATFSSGIGPDGGITSIILLSDGKILIGGTFNAYNATTRRFIARLNSDGSLDMTFNASLTGNGSDEGVYDIAVQSDNKIVISGDDIKRISDDDDFMRLHPDGGYDTTFLTTADHNLGKDIYSIITDADGFITIGGKFKEYNNESIHKLARLNPDGTRDETFIPLLENFGINEEVIALALKDGQLLIGGTLGEYSNCTINNIAAIIYNENCAAPVGLYADNITATKATTHWTNIPSADSYQIWVRAISGGPWTKKTATVNFKALKSLAPETTYEYKVRTKCSGVFTDFSAVENFTTLPLREGHLIDALNIEVYPNPASDKLFVELENYDEYISMEIFDILGNKIENFNSEIEDELISMDISQLPAGVYILNISNTQMTKAIQFVHQ